MKQNKISIQKIMWLFCISAATYACEKKSNPALEKAVLDSRLLILEGKYDSAKLILDKAKTELDQPAQTPAVFEEISYLTDESKTDKILINMLEDDYKLLLDNKYHKDFFFIQDSLIEEKVNLKLYEKRNSRMELLKTREEPQKVSASPSDLAEGRKFLQSMPQPACGGSQMSVGSDGAVIIRVLCEGNGKSMDGMVEIKNGIVRKIK